MLRAINNAMVTIFFVENFFSDIKKPPVFAVLPQKKESVKIRFFAATECETNTASNKAKARAFRKKDNFPFFSHLTH